MKLYLTDESIEGIKEAIPADWFIGVNEALAKGEEIESMPIEFEDKGKTLLFELFPDCTIEYCGKGCDNQRKYNKVMNRMVKLGFAYWAEPVEEVFEGFADTKPRNFWHS